MSEELLRQLIRAETERDQLRERVRELETTNSMLVAHVEEQAEYIKQWNNGELDMMRQDFIALREALKRELQSAKIRMQETADGRNRYVWIAASHVKGLCERLLENDDAGGKRVSNSHDDVDTDSNSRSSSFIGKLLVRKALYRDHDPEGRHDLWHYENHSVWEPHPITGEHITYIKLTNDPADLPYKLAWEALLQTYLDPAPFATTEAIDRYINEHGSEPDDIQHQPPNGLYEVWRVGDCLDCDDGVVDVTADDLTMGQSTAFFVRHSAIEKCPTCRGDGGRYELRPEEKEKP
jgi:hypothetical protein